MTGIDIEKYVAKDYQPYSCCPLMDMALNEGYLHPTISFFKPGPHAPHIEGPRVGKSGRKSKPQLLVNYCPWCGKELPYNKEVTAS